MAVEASWLAFRRLISTGILGGLLYFLFMTSATAQPASWQPVPGKPFVNLPRPLQGDPSGRFYMICFHDASSGSQKWIIEHTSKQPLGGPNGESTANARFEIDGMPFPTTGGRGSGGNEIVIPPASFAALKSGSQLTIAYPSGGIVQTFVLPMNGSTRAIEYLASRCPLPASATTSTTQWKTGPEPSEISTANKPRTAFLILGCVRGNIWLELDLSSNRSGWRGDQAHLPFHVRLATETFPMQISGRDGGVVLSNNTSVAFRSALRRNGALVLEGPASASMTVEGRAFSLVGLGPLLTRLERSCGTSASE